MDNSREQPVLSATDSLRIKPYVRPALMSMVSDARRTKNIEEIRGETEWNVSSRDPDLN